MGWVVQLDPSLGMLFLCRTLHYRIIYPMPQVSRNQSLLIIVIIKYSVKYSKNINFYRAEGRTVGVISLM